MLHLYLKRNDHLKVRFLSNCFLTNKMSTRSITSRLVCGVLKLKIWAEDVIKTDWFTVPVHKAMMMATTSRAPLLCSLKNAKALAMAQLGCHCTLCSGLDQSVFHYKHFSLTSNSYILHNIVNLYFIFFHVISFFSISLTSLLMQLHWNLDKPTNDLCWNKFFLEGLVHGLPLFLCFVKQIKGDSKRTLLFSRHTLDNVHFHCNVLHAFL